MAERKHVPETDVQESMRRKHETTDADFKSLVVTGFGLLGIMIAGLVLSWAIYVFLKGTTPEPGMNPVTFAYPDGRTMPPYPRLQASPRDSLQLMRIAEDSVLSSYGWVQADSGIARVPIDSAKELLVKKGLPYQTGSTSLK